MKRGFTLIEAIISIGVIAIMIATFMPTVQWLTVKSKQIENNNEASLLLQEGMEVAYNVLVSDWDVSWGHYKDGKLFFPAISGSKWILDNGKETGIQATFDRQIEFLRVCRRVSDGDWKKCADTSDPAYKKDDNSRYTITTVFWTENGKPVSISAEALFTNLGN
jgi:prepilin-type N-terminal cleavage/methylation domain-containing protein